MQYSTPIEVEFTIEDEDTGQDACCVAVVEVGRHPTRKDTDWDAEFTRFYVVSRPRPDFVITTDDVASQLFDILAKAIAIATDGGD